MKLLLIIFLMFNISLVNANDCIGFCMSKHEASVKSRDKNYDYLKLYCDNKKTNHIEMKKDFEKANLEPYSMMNSKEFLKFYCSKTKVERISKCIKRLCVKRNKSW